ncbi:LPS translocon maturation chaperone LptM [Halomonas daqiaonensis]|uniref:Predicted small lipoprotein YifL n=1 Tax=Halomonas daqiaonensis TaxID=650850 RepID=A0A1H7RVN0_9GAMM|nr:lipoprotein [Halomonas daqiaonensis]SEL64341.1 Predicted small lipoprotein YifL [Halomonas daqiaonensis]
MRRLAPLTLTMALAAGLFLAGCGQKGPLYLPGNEAAAERYDPAGQQEASDEDAARQDDDTARDDES